MYYCDNCPLLNKMTPILPTGSISPDIYFLGSVTSNEDIENKKLYSDGSESVYLNNMIRTTEISNYRVFNMVRCSTSKSYDKFDEVKNCCFNFAKFDIVKTKPKIIILLGTLPSKELLGDKFKSIKENGTKVYNIEIDGLSTKVIPTYSISSIMDNFSYSSELMNSLLLAKSVLEGKVVDINSKEILVATSYKEFEDYYNNNLSKSDFISYDIETNALDPRSEDAEIVGFSMSADGSSGMYVSRMSLSHRIPEEEWDKIVELAVSIISNNKILVHNCMYEIPFTLNKFNHYITNFEDSLIKARLVLGGTIGAGLKPQCIKYLGYPEWDKDLSEYLSSMSEIISGLKPSPSGKSRSEYTTLLNGSIKDLTHIESEKKRELSIKNSSLKIIKLVCEYYDSYEERINILDLIKSEIISRVNIGFSGILSYGVVPLKIISRYGAIDSIATHDLNKYLDGRIESLSKELKINLTNGYKYLKQHFISGTWMELSGLHWDDKIANEEYKWYSGKCIETSMNMVNSGLLDEYLFNNNLSVYNDYLVEDHLDELIDVFGEFDIKKTGIKLKSTGKLIRYKNILSELGQEYIDSNHDKILSMIKNKISQIKDYTDIKYYYNPSSTLPEVIKYTTNFLVTDEIKLAKFLDVLMTTKDTLHSISTELELLRTIDDYDKYNKLYGEYESSDNKDEFYLLNKDSIEGNIYYNGEFVKISSRDRFLKFYEVLENTAITNKDIEKLLMESYKFSKDSLSELDIIELNHLYILTGIDYDNLDTWTTEYKFLVNYRIWKKCNKIITSYINGSKVGRGSVYVVDKKNYSSGSLLTPRKRLYDGIVKDDEDCVMQSKLSVCTAESYRWRSGMHTIPMGSSVRHIYTSRFKGGVIAAPDFCLSGDTKIRLANGTSPKIKDLVGLDEFYVYSYDENSRRIKIGRGHDARLVRYADDMYRITLENGDTIECTSNHKFFDMKSESMKEVKDLVVGDSLLPIRFSKYDAHGVYHKDRECVLDPWDNHQVLTHYLADEYNLRTGKYLESSGTDRHHIDMNKYNNDPRNIVRLTRSEHISIHARDRSSNQSYIEGLRSRARNQWTNQSYRDKMHQVSLTKGKDSLLRSNSDPHSIGLRKIAKRMKSMNKLHNALVDMQLKGIVPSPHTWDDCLSQIDHPRGCKSRAITNIYGDFAKFIYIESETYDYHKEYIDAITSKIYFENRTNNRTLSTIKRCYDNARKLGLSLSNNLEWDMAVSRLRKSNIIGKFDGISSDKLLQIFKSFDNVHKYCMNNHKISKIEKLSDINVPVYCFTVDEYHNFFLDCGVLSSNSQMELRTMAGAAHCEPMIEAFRNGADIHLMNASKIFRKHPEEITHEERRYSKMASFMILYGGDYKNFSQEFLNGDEKLGKYIYDSFYSAYPEVENYIQMKHKEAQDLGKVTTLMDMFMYCTPEMYKGDINRQMRVAQNSVIQSASSMIAGCCLYQVMKYIQDHNLKTKIILFVHDSIEIDIPPEELLEVSSNVVPLMNKFPNEQFKMPVKADLVIGASLGKEVTVNNIECDDSYNEGTLDLEGYDDEIEEMITEWRKIFKLVEVEQIGDYDKEFKSWSQLWIPKLAMQKGYGKTRLKSNKKVHVIIK